MTRESLDEDDDVPFDEFHVTEIEGAMQKLLVSLLGHCQGGWHMKEPEGNAVASILMLIPTIFII